MKKIRILFSTVLLLIICFMVPQSIFAMDQQITDAGGGGRYYVTERLQSNDLGYGIRHYIDAGMSSTNVPGRVAGSGDFDTTALVPDQFYTQQVNVLEVPSSQGVQLINWADFKGHAWNRETVRDMITDFEIKNPGWTVQAAINGDFFDINRMKNLPLQTNAGVISFGNNYKTTYNSYSDTIGFKNDGSNQPLIFGSKPTRTANMMLEVLDEHQQVIGLFPVEKNNAAPGNNETAAYFAVYNSDHEIIPRDIPSDMGTIYVVEQAALALPNATNDFYGLGEISSNQAQTLGIGQFAIVTNNASMVESLEIGATIRLQYHYTGIYAEADSIMGYNGWFLENGMYRASGADVLNTRHPRTVVGVKENGTMILMVVDGRQVPLGYYGAHGNELASMMKRYGAIHAFNLDGGGSSTMVIRQGDDFIVTNSPSDGAERRDSNALLVVSRDPTMNVSPGEISTTDISIHIDIISPEIHDIQKLLVRLNNQTKEVQEGVVAFSGLRTNTPYTYRIYYEDSNGVLYNFPLIYEISTLKREYSFSKLDIVETAQSYSITANYRDRDDATTISNGKLIFNDQIFYLVNGFVEIEKETIGDFIISLYFMYQYDYNIGVIEVAILNPHYHATIQLNHVIDDNASFIDQIYG